jgi:putative SOS response-associated peptidase YedK
MCGRYYIEIEDKELRDICDAINNKQREEEEQLKIKLSGEVFPTDIVPIIIGLNKYLPMRWGFSGFDKRPIINARSETALTKPTFRESRTLRRCLIPASGYYEWKREGTKKTRHSFYIPGEPIYMAGCYRQEANVPVNSFVILTRAAAAGLEDIHDRMPVIIPKGSVEKWLHDSPAAMAESITDLEFY